MSYVFAFAVYFIIWWTTLFAVLPFGVRSQEEAGEVVPGTPEGAPARPRLLWLFGVNTLVATVVFAIVLSAYVYQWIPLDRIMPGKLGV